MIDCIDLPIRTLHALYTLAFRKSKADAEKLAAEEFQEVLEEGG